MVTLGMIRVIPVFFSIITETYCFIVTSNSEHDTVLVATLDGTINLLDLKSAKTLWSFASGSSIYSSYQAPVNHDGDEENASDGAGYFIDCGDDWKLYADNGLRKMVCPLQSLFSI